MALRAAILRHVRVPVKTLTLAGRKSQPWGSYGASLRFLSSHGDDHLSKDEVIERVLSVIKSFPKVDPSQLARSSTSTTPCSMTQCTSNSEHTIFHNSRAVGQCRNHSSLSRHLERQMSINLERHEATSGQVTPDVHFQKDLGLDSLDNVEIVMALEEEFKLEIPDKEADKIDSCNLAIEYIYNHPMAG
uniref:Acyl carrier protein n=1 Tax=Quercus lobata TaxID=97700 RepID=A0A7N2LEP1_QUELO